MKRRGFMSVLLGCFTLGSVSAAKNKPTCRTVKESEAALAKPGSWIMGMSNEKGSDKTVVYYENIRTGEVDTKTLPPWGRNHDIIVFDDEQMRRVITHNNAWIQRPLTSGSVLEQYGSEEGWALNRIKTRWIGSIANPEREEANRNNEAFRRDPHRGNPVDDWPEWHLTVS